MKHERLDRSTESWRDDRGTLTISAPRPGIVLQRFEGYARVPMADAIIERLDVEIAAHETIYVFDDWFEAVGYDSEVRLKLTEWTRRHASDVRETHVLFRSKLIAMGLSVASLALGRQIHTYARRIDFEKALAKVVSAL